MKRFQTYIGLLLIFLMVSSPSSFALEMSREREAYLYSLAESQDLRGVLSEFSNEELLEVAAQLRTTITGLNADLAVAVAMDQDRFGYRVRHYAGVGFKTSVVLMGAGIVDGLASRGRRGERLFMWSLGGAALSMVAGAGGQVIVWLTPSERAAVQAQIDKVAEFAASIEQRLR